MAKASEVLDKLKANEDKNFVGHFLDAFFERQNEMNRRRRERQIAAALAGLDELKRQNEMYPTAKRTAMIQDQEQRLRESGILK